MPTDRYFLPSPLKIEDIVILKEEEFHHLTRVMRGQIGDSVELINGMGILATGRITDIAKREATLLVENVHKEPLPSFEIIIAQAMPKGNRLDTILEKGTELGMTAIWLFPAEWSEKKQLSANQEERTRNILISAIKQCGRLYLPQVKMADPLDKWDRPILPCFFGDTRPEASTFAQEWAQVKPKEGIIFCIGPETGFSKKEVDALHKLGAYGVKLHQNILRTDTAPLCALSQISLLRA